VQGGDVADVSGNGHTGKLRGAATATGPGRIGDGLALPRAGAGWVEVGGLPLPLGTGDAVTITLWFFRRSGDAVDDSLFYLPSSPRYDAWLTARAGKEWLCINSQNLDCWGVEAQGFRDRWVHVAAVLVNGPITGSALHVDGVKQVLRCQDEAGFEPCTAVRTVGTTMILGGEADFPFHGTLDDVRIYDRRLTDEEIARIHAEAPR
jgi:hypothetical protein